MFEDFEINPFAVVAGLVGGILTQVVMSTSHVNIVFRIGSFLLTTVVCYFMANRIFSQ